jgi:hypothetical protein
MGRVLTSTATLIWLAVVLPLLALLAAQFQIGCESGCSPAREIVGALVLPIAIAWLLCFRLVASKTLRCRHSRPTSTAMPVAARILPFAEEDACGRLQLAPA